MGQKPTKAAKYDELVGILREKSEDNDKVHIMV